MLRSHRRLLRRLLKLRLGIGMHRACTVDLEQKNLISSVKQLFICDFNPTLLKETGQSITKFRWNVNRLVFLLASHNRL